MEQNTELMNMRTDDGNSLRVTMTQAPQSYCSYRATNDEEKKRLFNAMNSLIAGWPTTSTKHLKSRMYLPKPVTLWTRRQGIFLLVYVLYYLQKTVTLTPAQVWVSSQASKNLSRFMGSPPGKTDYR